MMVANIMKNERRWGDLEARKSIVVDYKLGKVTKNNGNRCSAYVPEHHEAIVSPEIARAAHLVASSRKKCGVQDIVAVSYTHLSSQGGTEKVVQTAQREQSEHFQRQNILQRVRRKAGLPLAK